MTRAKRLLFALAFLLLPILAANITHASSSTPVQITISTSQDEVNRLLEQLSQRGYVISTLDGEISATLVALTSESSDPYRIPVDMVLRYAPYAVGVAAGLALLGWLLTRLRPRRHLDVEEGDSYDWTPPSSHQPVVQGQGTNLTSPLNLAQRLDELQGRPYCGQQPVYATTTDYSAFNDAAQSNLIRRRPMS